ncbi:hypothetical protein PENTCL1PPCAC_8327, partial [Pristionchus entomophagus]
GDNALVFTKQDVLPEGKVSYSHITHIFQVEDGTIFYHRFFTAPKTLFVKWNGKEIEVALPEENRFFGAQGNGVYFDVELMNGHSSIYRATFSPEKEEVTVCKVRDMLPYEVARYGGMCSMKRDGKTLVHRMSDDPLQDGVLVDVADAKLEELALTGMHRGKAIYTRVNPDLHHPSARMLCKNAILVELISTDFQFRSIAFDSLPFVYFSDGNHLFSLDTETLEFLPALSFGIEVIGLGGIHDGVLTVLSKREEGNCLATARLPDGYF